MKLSDKALVVKPLTVAGTIQALRAMGKMQDALDIEAQVRFFEESTNWTATEIGALAMTEYPAFAKQFSEAFTHLAETAIPPPIAPPSKSGPAATGTQSHDGPTS